MNLYPCFQGVFLWDHHGHCGHISLRLQAQTSQQPCHQSVTRKRLSDWGEESITVQQPHPVIQSTWCCIHSKNVEVETDRNRCWKLNIEDWWRRLDLIYMYIFLTDLRALKWLFAQLTRPTYSAAIIKKRKKNKLEYSQEGPSHVSWNCTEAKLFLVVITWWSQYVQ